MITHEDIKKIDKKMMCEAYDLWPEIAKKFYESNLEKIHFNDVDQLIFAGMGGSGTIGDIFSAIFSKTKIPVIIVKGYHLPKTITKKTLVVVTSVSGNTAETINVLKSTVELNIRAITFSSGGEIINFCEKNKLDYRLVEKIHSPRASLPAYLYSVLNVLEKILPINKDEIEESIQMLEEIKNKNSMSNLNESNIALKLSDWIEGVPIIYYPWGLQSAAIRFKNSLQENSKQQAIAEDIIEACHNGIVPWEKQSNSKPILIQGKDDFFKTVERWKIIKSFFSEKKIDFFEIISEKGNILSKLICLIYVLDYSSIYYAVKNGIDPSPVLAIDFIKSKS